ncbi:MAG: carboxypeptidase regulatory-like domain-containing protein [Thermoanaerobaculia bacterium]|nr:carboxypeptidase regulatory-like domain-containing protein [Thermoanaerobaculia bacterium]MCZ7649678.1 carboxypeptidase-like regulatory domain-containing protein [Thermoanaerobaculia bacterium]
MLRIAALLLALAGLGTGARADVNPGRGTVSGQVLEGGVPLPSVQVYAYQLVDRTLRLATTGNGGEFLFDALPAGLYKLVAFKRGFAPAVVLLTRASRDAAQWVELQLGPAAEESAAGPGDDFWSLREEVPPDVLRELATGLSDTRLASLEPEPVRAGFAASMSAETGTSDLPDGYSAAMTGGEVRLEGHLKGLLLRLDGDYRQLSPATLVSGASEQGGEATSLAVHLAHGEHSELDLRSHVNRLSTLVGGELVPVDFQQYGVRWRGAVGAAGESAISAWYTEESGLHAKGALVPASIPTSSRSVRFEGTYERALTQDAGLRAGLRFRERTGSYLDDLLPGRESARQFEAFGSGDLQLGERFDLEYGLAGGLRAEGVAVTPRAGVGIDFGRSWRGEAAVSHRFEVEDGGLWEQEFVPLMVVEEDACEMVGLSCYQLGVRRGGSEGSLLSVDFTSREFDRTVRLYFSRDFFDHFESLFLVPGDRVPEMRVTLSRQFGGFLVARWESIAAVGGGGTFLAGDQNAYRNGVSYLVTSLDTRFVGAGTGVVLAFHRLSQELESLGAGPDVGVSSLDAERLQLTVVQDLNVFFDLATEWAMRVNMELARGTTAHGDLHPGDGFRRRLTTGLSVRF